jgi:uncharacterized protein (TIGR01244 family)
VDRLKHQVLTESRSLTQIENIREERPMNFMRAVTPEIAIGDQPTEADLAELKKQGYRGIVNLRNDGEPDQPMSTALEGEKARALGFDYLHYGVGAVPLSERGVTGVCDFIDQHSGASSKVLVHCRRGPRAAALVLLQQARANKWNAAEAVAKGKAMGLDVDGGLKMLVESYLSDKGE